MSAGIAPLRPSAHTGADCCACTTPAVGTFRDGAHLKPVCEAHHRLFQREQAQVQATSLLLLALDHEEEGDLRNADLWLELAAEEEAHAHA